MAIGSAQFFFDDDSAVLKVEWVDWVGQQERQGSLGSTGDNFSLVEEVQQLVACDHWRNGSLNVVVLNCANSELGRPDHGFSMLPS